MTEELLALLKDVPPERLAAEGNHELALEHVQRFVSSEEDRARRRMEVRQARSVTDQVLVPLVGPSVLTTVRIEEGLHDVRWADDDARESARRAIEDAWADVGGPGAPPPVTPALGIGADVPVRGSSAYLGIYLAAVARFGDQPLHGNVVATGCFDAPLAHVAAKQELFANASRRLRVEQLLYAGTHEVEAERLLRVHEREDARHRVFHFDPWHRQAPVRQIHVHCGPSKAAPPRRFTDAVPIELPDHLEPRDLPEALARFRQELEGVHRAELCIAGPVLLAAALGVEARNAHATVRIVHRDGQIMWDNRAAPPEIGPTTDTERRLVIGHAPASVPTGWRHHPVPKHLTPHAMPELVRAFFARGAAAPSLHLAFATALPVAWAVAGMLKNRANVRYYHWSDSGYVPWFEQRRGRAAIEVCG